MNNRNVGSKAVCYFVDLGVFRDNPNALAISTKLLVRVKYDNVTIPAGVWMVLDEDPPPLRRLYLDGGLEIDDNADRVLEVEILWIRGGEFVAGTEQKNLKSANCGGHKQLDPPPIVPSDQIG